MANSTKARKPRKQSPDFPLSYHKASGNYCKKVDGRRYYFGHDPDEALARWKAEEKSIREGVSAKPQAGLTLKDLANTFLTHKKSAVEIGELTLASFNDYLETCERLCKALGKETAVESIATEALLNYRRKLAKTLGPVALGNEVQRCRVVFNFAFNNGLVDKPIRYGDFKKPGKSAKRKARKAKGSKLFEADELRTITEAADIQLRAMILLAINCGFGNADCGRLPIEAVDLESGWVDYPRDKTGIDRRCPLWPETIAALREYLPTRKTPGNDDNAGLLFITKHGAPWYVDGASGSPVSAEFRKLLNRLELYREGLSFYALRHTFQTVADRHGDYLATRRVMGHADHSISDHYREEFDDARLVAVVDHVRGWLFGTGVAT